MAGLPKIEVVFQGKAETAVKRSSKGVVCLVLKDTTNKTESVKVATKLEDLTDSNYSDENWKVIKDLFLSDISKALVIKVDALEDFDTIKANITTDVNWLAYAVATGDEHEKVINFVKDQNKTRTKRLKAIVFNKDNADNEHIINFVNTHVKRVGEMQIEGHLYLGRLLGVFATCPLDSSTTYKVMSDLESVTAVNNIDDAINAGKLCLFDDDGVIRIARGVNTLQTLDGGKTEDMKRVDVIEAMDLMKEDIVKTFKNEYVGKYKNNYDNQMLFISAVNSYFRTLQAEDILDNTYNSYAEVDVEKQRQVWIAAGKQEAAAWSEKEVKNNTYSTNVYLKAQIKVLSAIEDLHFVVSI